MLISLRHISGMPWRQYLGTATSMINKTSFMKKRRNKFKKRFPRVNNLADAAGKIFGLQKQISIMKGIINSERKYADVSFSAAVSSTGTVTLVNSVAAGDDVANRDGNSILHKYLAGQFSVTMNASATASVLRFMIVVDTANQGVTPGITDILEAASTDALKNKDQTKRFVILLDKKLNLSINGNRIVSTKVFRRTNFHCRYFGTTATDVLQNAIYTVLISNEATNTPSVAYNLRNAFYDN